MPEWYTKDRFDMEVARSFERIARHYRTFLDTALPNLGEKAGPIKDAIPEVHDPVRWDFFPIAWAAFVDRLDTFEPNRAVTVHLRKSIR